MNPCGQPRQKASRTWCRIAVLLVSVCFGWLGASAQDAPDKTLSGAQPPLPFATAPIPSYKSDFKINIPSFENATFSFGAVQPGAVSSPGFEGVRTLTLEEAKAQAAAAGNPLVRLGELSVEVAKQHRLGAQGDYFPQIGSTLYNMHLNKQTGQVLTVERPLTGGILSVPVNIFAKNQTIYNLNAVQPITPLFAIYQLVKIARADENIARAKVGLPVKEIANQVEKNYFDLLVAQRELTGAEAGAKKVQAKWLRASNSTTPDISAEQQAEMAGAEKAVLLASSKVQELTASLNGLLGFPENARLDLVPPPPLVENVSLTEATENATAANPEVVEAEQTAIKAHAGKTLSKMAYFPVVAMMGGYSNQNAITDRVLPQDFGYIGLVATFTVFDGFKREHGVKERSAQAEMADLAVTLTKAKVAAGVKSSYFELDRSRQLYQMACRMVSGAQVVDASYKTDDPDVKAARTQMEADMFRAELDYRMAYAKVKAMMGVE